MGFRFEFDPANNILLTRMEGELTDDVVREVDVGMRKHLAEKNPLVHIVECSSVTKFSISGESVRHLAKRQPALKGKECRRFFVMPSTVGFGMARMFQISGGTHYEAVTIVHSQDEVFSALGIERPQFELLN